MKHKCWANGIVFSWKTSVDEWKHVEDEWAGIGRRTVPMMNRSGWQTNSAAGALGRLALFYRAISGIDPLGGT